MENIPQRDLIKRRLTDIWDYEKVSAPFKRGGKYYYYKNEGLQDQSVLYYVDKLEGDEKIILGPSPGIPAQARPGNGPEMAGKLAPVYMRIMLAYCAGPQFRARFAGSLKSLP